MRETSVNSEACKVGLALAEQAPNATVDCPSQGLTQQEVVDPASFSLQGVVPGIGELRANAPPGNSTRHRLLEVASRFASYQIRSANRCSLQANLIIHPSRLNKSSTSDSRFPELPCVVLLIERRRKQKRNGREETERKDQPAWQTTPPAMTLARSSA